MMEQSGKSKKTIMIVILAVILIAVCAAGGYFTWKSASGSKGEFALDEKAQDGFLGGKSPEDIEALLNQKVPDGMFNISINSDPAFEDGKSEGNLRIENVPGNPYYMTVQITRDDTGDRIYQSGGLKQKQYIENARLGVELPKGEYPCTAVFTAVDPETLEAVGTAAAKITLHVLN